MTRYIEPITDFGFKKLFGEEKSKNVLKSFLFHILDLKSPIAEISFLKQEQLPETSEERVGVYDIYCIDEKGERFIVEMQRTGQLYFKDRVLYHSTFPIYQQAQKGDWAYRLNWQDAKVFHTKNWVPSPYEREYESTPTVHIMADGSYLYPYLTWAEAHFWGDPPPMHLVADDYPLTWECQASQADYEGMRVIDQDLVYRK